MNTVARRCGAAITERHIPRELTWLEEMPVRDPPVRRDAADGRRH